MYKIFSLHISKWKLILLAGDAGAYCLAVLAGLYFNPKIGGAPFGFLARHGISFLLMGLAYLLVNYIVDLYDYQKDYRRWSNVAQIVLSSFLGTLVIIVLFYFPLGAFVGRTLLIIQAGIFTGLLVFWRYLFSAVALPQRLQRRVLIVGAGKCGRRILEAIRQRPQGGLAVVGFIDDDPQKIGTAIDGLPVLGDSSQLPELISRHELNLAVVAITHEKSLPLINALNRIYWKGCQLMDMPSLYEFLAGKVPVDHISDMWFYLQGMQGNRFYYRHLKRLIDLGLAMLGLALGWPLFVIIAVAIKKDTPGPVFYRQERLGQDSKLFQILKFRTMHQDAEHLGPQWASDNDERVTRVGRFLRKTRLDELPQLLNVLKGEMSFIGPRPEREVFVKEFQEATPRWRVTRPGFDSPEIVVREYREKVPYYSFRLLVKPGLTGWAQVMYPYASSLDQSREKLEYDLYYIKNMGFFLDLAILLKTVRIIFFGRGT